MALNTGMIGMPWLGQPGDAGQSLQQGASAGAAIAAAAARRSEGRLRAAEMQHRATVDLAEEERRKQEYEREAENAAIRAEGQRALLEEHDWTQEPMEKLFPKYAPRILYGNPTALMQFYSNLNSVEQRRETAEALNKLRVETQERLSKKDEEIVGLREREVKVKEDMAKERRERNVAGSPVGKLLDDLRLARERGDTEGVAALQKSIEIETSIPDKQYAPSDVKRLMDEQVEAIERGDINQTRVFDAAIQKATSTRNTTTRFDPITGEVTITEGAQEPGGIEKTTKAQIEQKLLSQGTLIEGLDQLISSGSSQYFGPAGAAGNLFVDKLFANVYRGAVNPERVTARQKLQGLKNVAVRALSDDRGQLSRQDQERVEKLFPTGGYVGSPAEAEILLRELRDELKRRSASLGESIGKPQLRSLSDDALRKAAIDGTIDRSEAQREFLRRRPVVVPNPK